MSLPSLRPEKTAAGIVVDPSTLERKIPSSKRQDGTVRKEIKIRPGFTPQEDVGRFRSTRQQVADVHRNIVPGSNGRQGNKKDPYARENPFAGDDFPPLGDGKPKSQSKNDKRRDKKRNAAADLDLKWDEDDGDGDGDMEAAFEKMDQLKLEDSTRVDAAEGQGPVAEKGDGVDKPSATAAANSPNAKPSTGSAASRRGAEQSPVITKEAPRVRPDVRIRENSSGSLASRVRGLVVASQESRR